MTDITNSGFIPEKRTVCALGLKNGVENITKVMMILLVGLMVVLVFRSVTLPGAEEGLKYYLVPDFKKLSEHGILNVIFAAMTHAFFTLSIGMGSMEIFGSYLSKERKLTGEAISVTILDTLIALMAGIIIIPSCFAYDVQPDAGPSLLYVKPEELLLQHLLAILDDKTLV